MRGINYYYYCYYYYCHLPAMFPSNAVYGNVIFQPGQLSYFYIYTQTNLPDKLRVKMTRTCQHDTITKMKDSTICRSV